MTEKHASHEQVKKDWAAQASAKEIADATQAATNGVGHNSNLQYNPEFKADIDILLQLVANAKQLNAEKRATKNKMKEKYGVPKGSIDTILAQVQMDQATLAAKEQGVIDCRIMLGIDLFNWQENLETDGADEEDPIKAGEAEEAKNKDKKIKAVK